MTPPTSEAPVEVLRRVERVVEAALAVAQERHAAPVARDVQRLSALFTTERGARASTYMRDPALRRAYLAYFVPANVAKLALLMSRLAAEGAIEPGGPLRVLDLGAGPLTGILAAWCFRGALGASYAVDLAPAAMQDGIEVLRRLGADVPRLCTASVAQPPASWLPPGPVDVVILANVLNELGDPRRDQALRHRVLDAALGSIDRGGRVLVVEPGTRVQGRALMAMRDELVDDVAILSPCRGARRCPMGATRGDWCHGELAWEPRPSSWRALEDAARLQKSVVKQSHLLLARREDARSPRDGLRLVGGVMRQGDVERRYACAAEGLVTLAARPRLPADVARASRGMLVDDAARRLVERGPPNDIQEVTPRRPPPRARRDSRPPRR